MSDQVLQEDMDKEHLKAAADKIKGAIMLGKPCCLSSGAITSEYLYL